MSSAGGGNKAVTVIHGPNLNLLGEREPDIYGAESLQDINASLVALGEELGLTVTHFHSNHEGDLVDAIQRARDTTDGLIINPAGYGHVSVALRDALSAYPHPAIEVHLSNIYRREEFRHHSLVSGVVTGVVCGFGADSYRLALRQMALMLA